MATDQGKDYITASQGERMGLAFTVEGTNIEAYRLVNGLQGAHSRVEDLLHNWEKLDWGTREEVSDQIVWLLGTAAKLIRQMSDRPDAPQHALTGIRGLIGARTQPPSECENCRIQKLGASIAKGLRNLSKSANFGTPPGYFEGGKLSETITVVHLKGGALRDRYYIIPIRDELGIFSEHLTHNPLDSVTIHRAAKQLLGHS